MKCEYFGLVVPLVFVAVFLTILPVIQGCSGQSEIPDDLTEYKEEEGFARTSPPILKIGKILFSEKYLDGGDTNTLSIPISNDGNNDARNLTIQIRISTDPKDLKEDVLLSEITEVPTIPKGSEKTILIDITGSATLSNGTAKIESYLVDSNYKKVIAIEPVKFKTRPVVIPKLELGEYSFTNAETGKSDIRLFDKITLKFDVLNNSNVAAENTKVYVTNVQAGVLLLVNNQIKEWDTAVFKEENIGKNSKLKYTLIYLTNNDFKDAKLEFEIEATTDFYITKSTIKKIRFSQTIKHTVKRKLKTQGEVNIGSEDDETPLHEKNK